MVDTFQVLNGHKWSVAGYHIAALDIFAKLFSSCYLMKMFQLMLFQKKEEEGTCTHSVVVNAR